MGIGAVPKARGVLGWAALLVAVIVADIVREWREKVGL